jgi:hypothetical protein
MIPRCFLKVLILLILFPPIVFAEDFKTVNGKEYKNATVSRVEPDGIVLKTKSGVRKIYFSELPKEVQERFHYDPQQAAAAQAAAAQQTEAINRQAVELDKQQKEAYKQQQARSAEQQGKVTNIQALVDRLADLEQQEVSVLAAIGRAENAQTIARRKWVDGQNNQQYTDPAEANLPLLRGRLENVRSEKERVRRELERAQHQ